MAENSTLSKCPVYGVHYNNEDYNPNFFKSYNDWNNPQEIEWVGYGYDSIKQGLDNFRSIEKAVLSILENEKVSARRELIAALKATRALPNQALI